MNKPINSHQKAKYRFRQCLKTGIVLCINAVWPPQPILKNSRTKHNTPKKEYRTVKFPIRPELCPKCKGKGDVRSQLTGKLLGMCYWCDGKGNINDADIVNAQRRMQSGLGIDNKSSG